MIVLFLNVYFKKIKFRFYVVLNGLFTCPIPIYVTNEVPCMLLTVRVTNL